MNYRYTTQIPNALFDVYLPTLSEAELKIVLAIARQTYGYVNRATGLRKTRDRMTNGFLVHKTGLCKRVISKTIKSLLFKNLISVTDFKGNLLPEAHMRKGKSFLYYSLNGNSFATETKAPKISKPMHHSYHNKTNTSKPSYPSPGRNFTGSIAKLLSPRTSQYEAS